MRLYLLDEHIPPIYRTQLLYHEPSLTVLTIGDEGAPARSTSDPEILKWCEQNNFNLITNNRNSIPQHLSAIWQQDAMCRAFSRLISKCQWD